LLSHVTSLSDLSKTARSNKAKVWSQSTFKFAKVPLVDEIFEAGIKQQNFLNILNRSIQALILREVNLHARGCGSRPGEKKFAKTQDIGGYLSLFRHTLQYEIPRLHFHHMNLVLRCSVFNKELVRSLGPTLEAPVFSHWLRLSQNPLVPLIIMAYERGYQMQQKSGDIDSDAKIVYTEPVFEAARVISKYLREQQQDQSWGT
jgi:hypothetical protein